MSPSWWHGCFSDILSPELYLLAFGPLRSAFTAAELRRIFEGLKQRGVRIRKELDVEREAEEEAEGDGEETRDEIERDAEEYRRLLPY